MNTFNFAINQSFYSYSSTLHQQFIAAEQNRVHVMSKTIILSVPQQDTASLLAVISFPDVIE